MTRELQTSSKQKALSQREREREVGGEGRGGKGGEKAEGRVGSPVSS